MKEELKFKTENSEYEEKSEKYVREIKREKLLSVRTIKRQKIMCV